MQTGLMLDSLTSCRGAISDFSWGEGGQRQHDEQSEPNLPPPPFSPSGGEGGDYKPPPREHFLILIYFMYFLKPQEQSISEKIRYKN